MATQQIGGVPMIVLAPAKVSYSFGGSAEVDKAEIFENGMLLAWRDGEANVVAPGNWAAITNRSED